MDKTVINKIKLCKTTKEIWDNLTLMCERTDHLKNMLTLAMQKFDNFKMKNGGTVDKMDDRFTEIINELTTPGKRVQQERNDTKDIKSLVQGVVYEGGCYEGIKGSVQNDYIGDLLRSQSV